VRIDAVTGPAEPGPRGSGDGPSTLRGVVTAAATGMPVEGAEVEVAGPGGAVVGRATTIADGRFSVGQLPADNYRLTVRRAGFPAAQLGHDHPGGRVHVELRAARITGTVTPADGAPGEGVVAEVAARDADGRVRARAVTDAGGSFSLDGLDAGRYVVAATSDGYFTTRREVDLGRPVPPMALELVPAELLGRVLAAGSAEPVLDAKARLRSVDGTLVGQSVTDPGGRFVIPLSDAAAGPGDDTTHHLEVTADGFEPATLRLALSDEPTTEFSVTLEETRRSPWLWAALAAGTLLLVALLFALFQGDDGTVPDLVGASIEEAADQLEAEELVLGEVTFTEAAPEVVPGTVLDQDPQAGATVQAGDAVDLTAAADPVEDPTVEVPRVTGRQESDALRLLDALQFDVVISRVVSEEAAGIVVAQDPAPRTELALGGEVRIDISEGAAEEAPPPGPTSEPVPDPTSEAAPEPTSEPVPSSPPEPDPEPGIGDGSQLPDVQLPDVELPDVQLPDLELPDVELPEVDAEEVRGFFEGIVEWFRSTFGG
jgi:hypothetical protein